MTFLFSFHKNSFCHCSRPQDICPVWLSELGCSLDTELEWFSKVCQYLATWLAGLKLEACFSDTIPRTPTCTPNNQVNVDVEIWYSRIELVDVNGAGWGKSKHDGFCRFFAAEVSSSALRPGQERCWLRLLAVECWPKARWIRWRAAQMHVETPSWGMLHTTDLGHTCGFYCVYRCFTSKWTVNL